MKFWKFFRQVSIDLPAIFEKIELPAKNHSKPNEIDESSALLAVAIALQAAGLAIYGELKL